ncbi:MAG: AAA family ATPase [Helicobacteraceae bacterium]|jgi:DNA transposition AAA+ family ATPase|nr:AAA family ATPase [Helicobacteraceae bacterium]
MSKIESKTEALKIRLREFTNESGASISALARSIGYASGSIISQWLAEREAKPFKGDRARLESAISKYLDNYDRKYSEKSADSVRYIETKDGALAKYVIDQAIKHRRMALIYGAPGAGKTTAVKKIMEDLPTAILIEADVSMTARSLFGELCRRLHIENPPRSLYEMEKAVCDALKKADRVIIIDEGEHLPHRALEMVRRVWDWTGTPIIYVGTQILMDNITGNARNAVYAQLKRRIRGKWEFRGLVREEADESGKIKRDDEELRRVCAEFGATSDEAIKAVYRVAGGNIGNAIDLLEQTRELAALSRSAITAAVVKEAAAMLLI